MSRSVSRRGRMRSEDQLRMQIHAQFIEYEVDGQDLVTSLYSYQTIDLDDKEEIMSKPTQVERIRRLTDILLFRGPNAFNDFLRCLDSNGYEHVSYRLRNTLPEESRTFDHHTDDSATPAGGATTSVSRQVTGMSGISTINENTRKTSFPQIDEAKTDLDNVFLTSSLDTTDFGKQMVPLANSGGSLDFHSGDFGCGDGGGSEENDDDSDPESKPISERVKSIEDNIYILGRRVTRAENRAQASAKLPEEELHILKVELMLLKTDTVQQISDLTKENETKDAVIQALTRDVQDKRTKLERAQSKIDLLERRIATLETEKKRAEADLRLVKQRVEDNEKQLDEQSSYFNAESLRMRNQVLTQQKRSKDQEAALVELQKRDMENNQKFKEQHFVAKHVGKDVEISKTDSEIDAADQKEQILAAHDELKEQQLNMAEQHQRINALANAIQGMAQAGMSRPAGGSNNNPLMCISGNSVSSGNDKLSSGIKITNAGKRWPPSTAQNKFLKRK